MFATTNIKIMPVIVTDSTGKRLRAKVVKLVISQAETIHAVIQQVQVELHKK